MWKQIWGQAAVIAAITVVASVAIFIGIMLFLHQLHDIALALGTILFIAISAGAWLLARRAEEEFAAQQSRDTTGDE